VSAVLLSHKHLLHAPGSYLGMRGSYELLVPATKRCDKFTPTNGIVYCTFAGGSGAVSTRLGWRRSLTFAIRLFTVIPLPLTSISFNIYPGKCGRTWCICDCSGSSWCWWWCCCPTVSVTHLWWVHQLVWGGKAGFTPRSSSMCDQWNFGLRNSTGSKSRYSLGGGTMSLSTTLLQPT
jgi:hypothetical protein